MKKDQSITGKRKMARFLKTHRVILSTGKEVPTDFFTIKDIIDVFNANPIDIENLFRSKDFPVCLFGKAKIVEANAFLHFWEKHPEISFGPVQYDLLRQGGQK